MSAWRRREVIGNATLYLGDCLEILPTLAGVDAIVTDPPYGIGLEYDTHDDSEDKWYELMDMAVPLMRSTAPFVVMPSCRIKALRWWYEKHPPDWIVAWSKGSPGHAAAIGFNDWEPHLVWGKPHKPMHDYFSTPLVAQPNGHPCPKPNGYAEWLVSRAAAKGAMVCDPFMGSGTTGVACMKLERHFIGIDKSPKYFDICCERIENAQRQERLFA